MRIAKESGLVLPQSEHTCLSSLEGRRLGLSVGSKVGRMHEGEEVRQAHMGSGYLPRTSYSKLYEKPRGRRPNSRVASSTGRLLARSCDSRSGTPLSFVVGERRSRRREIESSTHPVGRKPASGRCLPRIEGVPRFGELRHEKDHPASNAKHRKRGEATPAKAGRRHCGPRHGRGQRGQGVPRDVQGRKGH